ncbi:unnamed protein product [Prorocentrum cordatum]|uniref:Uncharacterized protein n=1 Tax=Prorocentrum cordatum TaxID=2364126 RepID=A0ABN9SKZ6_9DINO|nr:unnamed protein product [Polarella glacialis]
MTVLPERTLFIVRHGVCSSAGRILLGGDIWGQDMLISNEHLRNKHRVRALSYLHVLKLHITDLADIVLVFPDARLQLRRAQVKISFTRGFKMVSRAVQSLGEEGLPWWEIPPEWRPLLYAQILNGCYNAGDWLQRRWSNADTAEAEHGNELLNEMFEQVSDTQKSISDGLTDSPRHVVSMCKSMSLKAEARISGVESYVERFQRLPSQRNRQLEEGVLPPPASSKISPELEWSQP